MEKYLVGKKGNNESGLVFIPYIMAQTSVICEPSFEEAKKEVVAVNRERQIDSILEDKEFIAYTLEETETYKKFKNTWLKPIKLSSRYSTINITKS